MKRSTQKKYLDINSYLEFKDISNDKWFFSKEMDKFLEEHDLPTNKDIKEQNLHIYIGNSIPVSIYNKDELEWHIGTEVFKM